MTKNRMWFGTRERMTWVKCPNSGLGMNRVGWFANGTYLNGGGWSRKSSTTHFEPNLTWSFLNHMEVRDIQDYYHGLYGPGPYFWLDPFAATTNALPVHWSLPRLAAEDAPPLVKGQRPTLSDTPNNSIGLPSKMATYEVSILDESAECYIPVPPKHCAWVAAWGSASGGTVLRLRRDTSETGTELVRQNLLTNPSAETTTGGWQTVRTNYANASLPGGSAAYSWSGGTAGAALVTGATDGPLPGVDRYQRRTITEASTGSFGPLAYTSAPATPTVGSTWTVSLWARSSAGTTMRLTLSVRNTAGTQQGTASTGSFVTLPANTWVRVSHTFTADAAGDHVGWWFAGLEEDALPVGATFDTTAVMVESGATLHDFHGGTVSPDPDLTSSWSGTAYASTSLLRGQTLAAFTSGLTSLNVAVRSTRWASSGAASVRIIPIGASSLTYTTVGGASTSTMNNGMVAGGTYTFMGIMHLDTPQTLPLNSNARRLAIRYNTVTGSTGSIVVTSEQAPNVAGNHLLRMTFTVPENALWCRLEAYNGAVGDGGDVWWDSFLLTEGEYDGPYFDGSGSSGEYSPEYMYTWSGSPHASASDMLRVLNPFDYVYVSSPGQASPSLTFMPGGPNGEGVILDIIGSGTITLAGVMAQVLPEGERPDIKKFLSGAGHSGVDFKPNGVNVTGYSAPQAIDYQSLTAEFIEVGEWRQ